MQIQIDLVGEQAEHHLGSLAAFIQDEPRWGVELASTPVVPGELSNRRLRLFIMLESPSSAMVLVQELRRWWVEHSTDLGMLVTVVIAHEAFEIQIDRNDDSDRPFLELAGVLTGHGKAKAAGT